MKFGVREICDVVFRAKANMKVGNKHFYKNEPVIYFDTLKTSSLEGAVTTVYANGGRGNARLVAWDGERTMTFTMEDALISPVGLMILSGAGLIEASDTAPIRVHTNETTSDTYGVTAESLSSDEGLTNWIKGFLTGSEPKVDLSSDVSEAFAELSETNVMVIHLSEIPYYPIDGTGEYTVDGQDYIYVMLLDGNGEVNSEPYLARPLFKKVGGNAAKDSDLLKFVVVADHNRTPKANYDPALYGDGDTTNQYKYTVVDKDSLVSGTAVMVDYYIERTSAAMEIDITPETFGGNFYVEASTLFRTQQGVDLPAEFIIPNCKVQSNFTFSLASSGDPSGQMRLAA